ncbi:helix-turn-helix domain-containing protein [Halorientalis pallida]|uniref:HTH DNA binding domain-containing protein n=1 Tax=Halorientalis pallida TaxID=2479928 RepID=A0A498L566_9EURY|nr:helix-turn-helix domain-containing protein [Halorientalis pallida]RXK49432.1 hypothetical protein EAF64_11010 [Halorientalis pallida]
MSLVVDFRVSGDPIDITAVAAAHANVTFEIEQLNSSGELVDWYLWADGEDLDRVTDAFESLAHVEEVLVLNDAGALRLYRVSLRPNVSAPPDDLLERGVLTEGYVRPHCLELTARVTGRDVITGVWSYLRENGIDVAVDGLRRAGDDDLGRLTDAQFEALATAYEMGYFDEPKGATHGEVADELGIARSSLSERLRRAERRLVQQQFGD